MSKKLTTSLALLGLPAALFSFEINFNKEFTKELMPDVLSTNLNIRIDSKDERKISKRLTKFNDFIKLNNQVERKLGKYTVRPNYKYSSSNTPKIIGYVGELKYKVSSEDAKSINSFITKVNKLKDSRDTSITVSGLSWKVKDETYNIALDILRLEVISWAQTYTKNLSEDLSMDCKIKQVDIGKSTNPVYTRGLNSDFAMEASSRNKSSIPVPEANHQKVTINPKYTLECK